jgi:uncharacterized Zn finger protein
MQTGGAMSLPLPTSSQIEAHTSGGSFERGQAYLANGAVRSLKRADEHTLKAQVQGSDVHPYVVTVTFGDDDVKEAACTCPYHEGSWCKHIVAALLKALKQTGDAPVAVSARIEALSADLDRDQLVGLLKRLAEHDPRLLGEIEDEHARMTGASS